MGKVWILGRQYDMADNADKLALLDLIENCKKRDASGDLSMIAFALMGVIG